MTDLLPPFPYQEPDPPSNQPSPVLRRVRWGRVAIALVIVLIALVIWHRHHHSRPLHIELGRTVLGLSVYNASCSITGSKVTAAATIGNHAFFAEGGAVVVRAYGHTENALGGAYETIGPLPRTLTAKFNRSFSVSSSPRFCVISVTRSPNSARIVPATLTGPLSGGTFGGGT